MTQHPAARQPFSGHHLDNNTTSPTGRVVLSGPADLADALPYLLGYFPDDSVVLVGLHGPQQRLGGRVRAPVPRDPGTWQAVAEQLTDSLIAGSSTRGGPPDAALLYICREPVGAEQPSSVMERMRPLAQQLRLTCGAREIPVVEALCICDGSYWSYCCPQNDCCPAEGSRLRREGASPMAAAATVAGVRVQGSLSELSRRLAPLGAPVAARQVKAFDAEASVLNRRMVDTAKDAAAVRGDTLRLTRQLLDRFERGGRSDRGSAAADARDDALLTSREAARLVLGLQDRTTRDYAAEWMEGAVAHHALRLWRALARRCVSPYREHAAAPMTLAGWVAWSVEDDAGARVALGAALETDPNYVFAQLLHQAVNDGLDPELLRRCMRRQRATRSADEQPGSQL